MQNPSTLHTPYDGTTKPFTIGLTQLDEAQWLEEDENLVSYLTEKLSLYRTLPNKVLVEDEGTREAQSEVLAMVQAHVLNHFPGLYRRDGNTMHIAGQHQVQLDDTTRSPIAIAGLLVQEDLVLMRKSAAGWKLAAASLCFPSAWNLLEKFKRPLHEIHKPVPGFGAGTRNAGLIERMFDNLDPSRIVLRWNWSLHGDAVLYHPHANSGATPRFGEGDLRGRVIIRLERQTLRKLPASGDILFTIRIHLNPLEMLEARPDRALLAASLEQQLAGLSGEEADYKGISAERARLAARLRDIAGLA
jgi:dimethylamine monooxygenase subunit A